MKKPFHAWLAGIAAMGLTSISGIAQEYAPPVVPGFERLAAQSESDLVAQGQLLLGELGCVACHEAPAGAVRLDAKQAPNLAGIGGRVTPGWLRSYLSDPHAVKPGSNMPNIFHASDERPKEMAVDMLTNFLVSLGGPMPEPQTGATETQLDEGRRLFETVGCVACHGADGVEDLSNPVVPMADLSRKTTVDALTAFLRDPKIHRPSGRMPSLSLTDKEAGAIAVYLLRDQFEAARGADAKPSRQRGLAWEYFEFADVDSVSVFEGASPVDSGKTTGVSLNIGRPKRRDNYGIRFSGIIEIDEPGRYRFELSSDDGSVLLLDGAMVVNNDGVHGNQPRRGGAELTAGFHEFEVLYFEKGNDEALSLRWNPPGAGRDWTALPEGVFWTEGGVAMAPIDDYDFVWDEQKASFGAQMFAAMRCVSCHEVDGLSPLAPSPALASLDPASEDGCLSADVRRGLPNYRLSEDQRAALSAALENADSLNQPYEPAEAVARRLASLNCYACHQRDGVGGPDEKLDAYFKTSFEIDLGPEGRIPPALDQAGAKLKPDALHRILFENDLHVRHYMATRMPQYGSDTIGEDFIEHLVAADGFEGMAVEPETSEEALAVGRRFVGATGAGCINCHQIAGQESLGIQGIDLSAVYERTQPGWFRKFLLDPAAYRPGTRMTGFWPGGKALLFPDLLDGDSEAQIDAIYSYLTVPDDTRALPIGIRPKGSVGMEIFPVEIPVVHRTFMNEVGPRSILAGYPERISVAFDANQVRMAKIWRGRFFDQSGVASGRTDRFLDPLSDDVLDLPSGPNFAFLDSPEASWPAPERTDRDVGGAAFEGYVLDEAKRPVFRYRLGGVRVEEKPVPVVEPTGPALRREVRLTAASDVSGFFFLVAEGEAITEADGEYVVDDEVRIRLNAEPSGRPFIRNSESGVQLLLEVEFDGGRATIDVETRW